MHVIKATTPRQIWVNLNDEILVYPSKYIEDCTTSYAFVDDVVLEIESADEYGLDLSEIGYTKSKWEHLLRHYFYPESFMAAVKSALAYQSKKQRPSAGIVFGNRARLEKPGGISSAAGQCLLSMVFAWRYANPVPRVEVFSRSADATRKLYADLVFIQVLIRTFAQAFEYTPQGFSPGEVSIRWHIPRVVQTANFVPAYCALIHGRPWLKIFSHDPDHPWTQTVINATPTRKDLESKYKAKQRAAEEYFRIMKGRILNPLPPKALALPVKLPL